MVLVPEPGPVTMVTMVWKSHQTGLTFNPEYVAETRPWSSLTQISGKKYFWFSLNKNKNFKCLNLINFIF